MRTLTEGNAFRKMYGCRTEQMGLKLAGFRLLCYHKTYVLPRGVHDHVYQEIRSK